VSTRIGLEEGTHPVVEVPPRLAGPLAKLDGTTRFRFEQRDARYLRELLEVGILAVRP
jgi:hypothetical protein